MTESLIDDLPAICFSVDEAGRLAYINKRLCQKLGYEKDELIGKKPEIIFTLPTRIFHETHLSPLLKMQGFADEIYVTLQTKEKQQLPVLINAERKQMDEEFCVYYTGIVVQNRKKFEDELVAAKKQAEAALQQNTALQNAKAELQRNLEHLDQHIQLVDRQNEEFRQFNRVVTHDLQEPLRKLFMFMDILANNKDEAAKSIEKIKKVSSQMHSIVSGLQQYVWLTDTKPVLKPTHLAEILSTVTQIAVKESPELKVHIESEEMQEINVDEEQVSFMIKQLLTNAVQFRKGNEVNVQITVSTIKLNKFRNIADKYKYEPFLKLQITDDGTGFDALYKDQVFDLFRKLHPQSGRGIGLSLCKKIAENHNGSITIDSELNVGTTIAIYLPLQLHGVKQLNEVLQNRSEIS